MTNKYVQKFLNGFFRVEGSGPHRHLVYEQGNANPPVYYVVTTDDASIDFGPDDVFVVGQYGGDYWVDWEGGPAPLAQESFDTPEEALAWVKERQS